MRFSSYAYSIATQAPPIAQYKVKISNMVSLNLFIKTPRPAFGSSTNPTRPVQISPAHRTEDYAPNARRLLNAHEEPRLRFPD